MQNETKDILFLLILFFLGFEAGSIKFYSVRLTQIQSKFTQK